MLLMPLLPMLIASAGSSGTDSTHISFGPLAVLHTPDAIAPALMPYLACVQAQRGSSLLKVTMGGEVHYDKNDRNCSATRKQSLADALKLLDQATIPTGSKSDYVENALNEIDAYFASTESREGPPIVMEDEVQPAFNRYRECLSSQLSYSSVSAETILSVFQRVMDVCRGVRDAAVIEAEGALLKKGWDSQTRSRAAEETFSAADEQWLAIARQYREALVSASRR
jgi:hypothetical protein